MPKVSVIIPVYNVENYLEKCLDSVCRQTLKDIEIIIVNDFSPDNSYKIIEKFALNDNRIRVLNFKENRGVAIARNTAIEAAKGEYVGFVDSDDYISLDFYEKLYNKAKKEGAELSVGRFYYHLNGNDFLNTTFLNKISENKLCFHTYFTTAIYKTDMLLDNHIRFLENCIYGEDRIVPVHSAYCANRLAVSYDAHYHCNENPNSVTRSPFTRKTVESYLKYIENMFDFILNMDVEKSDISMLKDVFEKDALNFIVLLSDELMFEFLQKLLLIFQKINSNYFDKLAFFNESKDILGIKKYVKEENTKEVFKILRKKIAKK